MKEIIKEEIKAASKKKDSSEDTESSSEWLNKSANIKLGFWINYQKGGLSRDVWTKFKNMNLMIGGFPKHISTDPAIIRIFWLKQDIREIMFKDLSKLISISGIFLVDQICYPQESNKLKSWNVKTLVGNKYKLSIEDFPNISMRIKYTVDLPAWVYVKDLNKENIEIRKYKDDNWVNIGIEFNDYNKDKKQISFFMNELCSFSVLLERKLFFPYISWYLRCINDHTAVLDLKSIN